jgi:nicotinamidase-related amidase
MIMTKRAVIVVDIQNEYFPPEGKLPLQGVEEAAANAAKVIAHARDLGEPVIHVRHEFPDPEAPFFATGTDAVKIHPAVKPLEGEQVITKNYPNSFRETVLKESLEKLGVTDVVVIGSMSHMCIDATSRAAVDYGYNTTIVHDACATLDLEFNGVTVPAAQVHAAFMSALAFLYGTVSTTEEFLAN